jgi:Holliday junction resolvasome RuvABC DNA-binding subunit
MGLTKMSYALTDVPGVGPSTAEILNSNNIDSVDKLAGIDFRELILVPGIGEFTGRKMIQAAKDLLASNGTEKTEKAGKTDKKEKKEKKKKKKDKKNKKGKNKKGKKNKK